jgi:hypothetical protein
MAPPFTFSAYQKAAQEAIRHTKAQLPLGAYNHPGELFGRLLFFGLPRQQMSKHRQNEAWDRIDADLAQLELRNDIPENQKQLKAIDVWAKHAVGAQAGNCQLQASVAFTYLRDKGFYPLDYAVILKDDGNRFKHAFIVMGRDAKVGFNDFARWQTDTMLCDPWRDAVGLGAMLRIWYPGEIYRLYARYDGPPAKKAA